MSQGTSSTYCDLEFEAYDTFNSIHVALRKNAAGEVVRVCKDLERPFSRFCVGGDLWRVNRSDGEPVACRRDVFELVADAVSFYEGSGHAFNCALGPVSRLWKLGDPDFVPPSADDVASALQRCDPRNVVLEEEDGQGYITVPDGMEIDLGGIAKGYAADCAVDELRGHGASSGFVNFGGNIAVVGPKDDGTPWRFGLQTPFAPKGDFWAVIPMDRGACATSGTYERYATYEGRRYHHILDPRTGCPVQNDVLTATVITEDATSADALSTALFVLGPQTGLPCAVELGVKALYLMRGGRVLCTPGFPIEVLESHVAGPAGAVG